MDLSLWFLWISLTFTLLHYVNLLRKKSSHIVRLPPGPTPLPIIGNLFELGDKPHRSLARLAKTHGPIMTLKLGQVTTIVISSPEAAREALQKQDQLLSSRSIPHAMQILGHHEVSVGWMPPSNPSWKNLRTILKTRLFSSQRLNSNQSLIKQKIQRLVSHLRGRTGQTVDIGRLAFGTTLNIISSILYSMDMVDLDSGSGNEFKDIVWSLMQEAGSPNISDYFPLLSVIDPQGCHRRATALGKKLFQLFDRIIDDRLQEKKQSSTTANDLLDELLQLNVDRRTIRSLIADLFAAGSDTSSGTVHWAMTELLCNPNAMARTRAELATVAFPGMELDISHLLYLQAVVKETFRLHPSAPLLVPHKADIDVELSGYTIPKHSMLLVNAWAIGRDCDVWEDAELFRPERFLGSEVEFRGRHFELIPFGSGRRMCPGLPLADRMVHLMLASLLNSFEWKLPDGMKPEDVDLTEKFGLNLALASPPPAIPISLSGDRDRVLGSGVVLERVDDSFVACCC